MSPAAAHGRTHMTTNSTGPAHLPDLARELVAGPHIAHLATLLPDGSPHTVPLWVAWEEDRLAFLTGPGSRKARNVARDPRVSVSVAHTEQPWLMATLFGRVERLVDGEQGWAVVDRIAHLYTGGPYPREQDRVAFLVDVDRASAASFA